ncbi:MAG: hypothetical protein EOM87_02640 [Clostridia bacterium]|nr:hypothetical protein [Clostridia bacterium]
MKKILLLVLVIATLAALTLMPLAGCSQVSQLNKLQAPWANYEQFTYDITKTTGESTETVGTMIVTYRRAINATVPINGNDFTVNGSYCTMELNITEGEGAGDSISSIVAFKTDFTPIASYRETKIGNETNTAYVRYNTGKNKGTVQLNGGEGIVFKHKGAFYDNEMMYYIIRASDLSSDSYTMAFAATDNLEGDAHDISVTRTTSTLTINTFLGALECASIVLTAAAEYGNGTSVAVAVAKSPVTFGTGDNARQLIKPIIKITEGAYSYTLADVSFIDIE